ncbi:TetR family transcriptional regulator [Mycolicibacterium bacteremicum]|uniref:TetR family transcriptional regulator n=1 Tax=Mycolicibacterium bacteremicum TaxID=564198 RepID=UPI0026EF3C97|nr:TetR family transcriptional regulator [Mycolicibacterium bacteremicum]
MSSPAVADVTYLQDQASRRKHTHRQVFGAAAAILAARTEPSLAELAARARIAPAAVSAHFPTVDAVFAELYLTRLHDLPLVIDPAAGMRARVSEQLRAITLVVADEPLLAAACAQALLREDDDAVAGVRARVAAEVHRRTAAALGMGAWPEVLDTVETLFWGALLQVRARVMSYHAMADRLDTMLELVLPDID